MNRFQTYFYCIGLFFFSSCRSVFALDLSAITVFGCDEQGLVDIRYRFNTGPVDACWDIFVYEGEVCKKENQENIQWLNHPSDHTIDLSLTPGTHVFTIHFDYLAIEAKHVGINLTFNGRTRMPIITAMSKPSISRPLQEEFFPNAAPKTMGWPITDVPGSGVLSAMVPAAGIQDYIFDEHGAKVTLKRFWIAAPEVFGNLDYVGSGNPQSNQNPDWVGQLVLEVEEAVPQPSDFFLWLQTTAGMTLGGPDYTEAWKGQYDYRNTVPPFSFLYDQKSSHGLLPQWRQKVSTRKIDANRTAQTLTYTDPETALEVRWQGVEYRDYHTVEWTVYLANKGEKETPIIENLLALDTSFSRGWESEFQLHYNRGDFCVINSYEPLQKVLPPNENFRLAPAGGRPTNTEFPYFNINVGKEGLIAVIGWPGQWAATFSRDDQKTLTLRAGQELTHFKLLPGEEVRSPLVVLQFRDQGTWIDGQNQWRRWMKEYSMPKPGGQLPPPLLLASSSRAYIEMQGANTENQIMFIQRYLEEDMKLDYWWMDAGWYQCGDPPNWGVVGTWEVDKKRFPSGFKPISDFAHAHDMKILVWFEPERVHPGTWIAETHPEWVFGGTGGGLLKLNEPEVLDWLVNHMDKLITDNGMDLYREDFNIDPLGFWRGNDAPDRQGITENHFVTNFLAYWDELLRRHPDMFIDTCASGGRRLDLETLRRSAPLWRSDYAYEPIGHQGQTYGLSLWLPYHGTGTVAHVAAPYYGAGATPVQPYAFWSNSASSLVVTLDIRNRELDYDALRKLFQQWRLVSGYYYGDFYPLLPYSLDHTVWMAWQFDRPEIGEGMVQVFRRADSDYFGRTIKLLSLDPEARYECTNLDTPDKAALTGQELMQKGVKISMEEQPGVVTLMYRKIK